MLLYTDGVTETFSPEDEIYGEARLCEVLQSIGDRGVRGLLEAVEKSVNEFRGPLPATDDLTMLAVKRVEIPEGQPEARKAGEAAG